MRLYLLLIIVSIFVLNCAISINNIRDYGSQGDYSNLVKHGKYSKNEDIRVATVEELRKIRKEESCIDLIDMASDESYKVKLAVCSALSKRLECKGAVSTIIKFTKDVQPRLRKHAKEVLIENKKEVKQSLVDSISNPNSLIRVSVIEILGTFKPDEEISELLIKQLKVDDSPLVRKKAAAVLGYWIYKPARKILFKVKNSDLSGDVRGEAEKSLNKIGETISTIRIGVVPLQNQTGSKNNDDLGIIFSDYISAVLAQSRICNVIEQNQVKLAVNEFVKKSSGIYDDESANEIGKFLTAQQIIYGAIQKSGNEISIIVKRMDVETLKILQSVVEHGYVNEISQLKIKVAEKLSDSFR